VVVEAGVLARAVAVEDGLGLRLMSGRGTSRSACRARRPWRAWDLVAELEVLEDVLDVGREAVEVGLEVGLELLLAGAGLEVAQGEREVL
jgi:hypothetical protein